MDKTAIIDPPLASSVAALASSLALGIAADVGAQPEPDAFVRAIQAMHDQLVTVRQALNAEYEQARAKRAELEAREKRVREREKRMDALEHISPLLAFREAPAPLPAPAKPVSLRSWLFG
jgi:hypothetical protein